MLYFKFIYTFNVTEIVSYVTIVITACNDWAKYAKIWFEGEKTKDCIICFTVGLPIYFDLSNKLRQYEANTRRNVRITVKPHKEKDER